MQITIVKRSAQLIPIQGKDRSLTRNMVKRLTLTSNYFPFKTVFPSLYFNPMEKTTHAHTVPLFLSADKPYAWTTPVLFEK